MIISPDQLNTGASTPISETQKGSVASEQPSDFPL